MSDPETAEDDQVYYAGEEVVQPVQRFSTQQKLALLDWHPMFTSRCPQCETPILRSPWECDHCGWSDDED